MKRFAIRDVETLKTTAAFYNCACGGGGGILDPLCPTGDPFPTVA